jgi:hypothetical protein
MTDDDVLPIRPDGENDAALAARVARHYRATAAPAPGMAARCTTFVLDRSTRSVARGSGFRRSYVLAGIAAAAAVLLISVSRGNGAHAPVAPAVASAPDASPIGSTTLVDNGSAIKFELRLPKGTAKVAVVGDFNGWDTTATPMAQAKDQGAWSAKVTLLPGRHIYAYIVNGTRWIVDPLAPQIADNDFGPANAVVIEGGTK